MKEYGANEVIAGTPEAVWAILSDAANYTTWDSGVERVVGRIGPGEKITVYSKINPGRGFPVTVSELIPAQRMVWTGGMPLGLFKGVRTFSLAPEGASTRFM